MKTVKSGTVHQFTPRGGDRMRRVSGLSLADWQGRITELYGVDDVTFVSEGTRADPFVCAYINYTYPDQKKVGYWRSTTHAGIL